MITSPHDEQLLLPFLGSQPHFMQANAFFLTSLPQFLQYIFFYFIFLLGNKLPSSSFYVIIL